MRNYLFHKYTFLFSELIKRDFKQRYKNTFLGIGWSLMQPLLMLLVFYIVFAHLFKQHTEHYVTYLFTGIVIFAYFRESTINGMFAFLSNAYIFKKIKISKIIFLLSKNIVSIINFLFSLVILFIFLYVDHLSLSFNSILLIYPIVLLFIFNFGISLILATLHIFLRDIRYLYEIIKMFLMYLSAIFYTIDIVPQEYRFYFLFNPLFCFIEFIRLIIINNSVPDITIFLTIFLYSILAVIIGSILYIKNRDKFIFYI